MKDTGSEENVLLAYGAEEKIYILNANDIIEAKLLWIRALQKNIKNNKHFAQWKIKLNLFTDDNGLLRCKGRIGEAPLPYDARFPIFLTKDSYFCELIIHQAHAAVGHNGCRDILTYIRRTYWIPKCRNFIRKLVRNCNLCKRFEGKPLSYPSAPNLPEFRVRQTHAFDVVGIDYAGPVYVKNIYGDSKKMFKAWIGLVTCANSRAVYLDLVSNSSSQECVELLKRLISRYGAPSLIISDNGKAFISEETQNFATSSNIIWKFNLELAPWLGGFFERMVKSVKRCLKKILVNARLTFQEMLTTLSEIELIINNRPLTHIYDELTEPPLTPNNLIYGRTVNRVVDNNSINNKENSLRNNNIHERSDYIKNILKHFWNRWKLEYITELREYHKGTQQIDNNINIDDVVLIVEEKLPRIQWRIGRVEKLIKGNDNKTRGARILTRTDTGKMSSLNRPVNKLVLLELNKNQQKDNVPTVKFIDENELVMNKGT